MPTEVGRRVAFQDLLGSWGGHLASRAWLTLADGYRSVNAAAESLIGLYKTELIRRRGPSKGLDNVELATL